MLSLPEVRDLGGVVVIDGVHPSVLQPVCCGHPSSLHLHGVHSGILSELQHHLAGHHLPSGECCISRSIQLQRERLYWAQCHPYDRKQSNSKQKHTFWQGWRLNINKYPWFTVKCVQNWFSSAVKTTLQTARATWGHKWLKHLGVIWTTWGPPNQANYACEVLYSPFLSCF